MKEQSKQQNLVHTVKMLQMIEKANLFISVNKQIIFSEKTHVFSLDQRYSPIVYMLTQKQTQNTPQKAQNKYCKY